MDKSLPENQPGVWDLTKAERGRSLSSRLYQASGRKEKREGCAEQARGFSACGGAVCERGLCEGCVEQDVSQKGVESVPCPLTGFFPALMSIHSALFLRLVSAGDAVRCGPFLLVAAPVWHGVH